MALQRHLHHIWTQFTLKTSADAIPEDSVPLREPEHELANVHTDNTRATYDKRPQRRKKRLQGWRFGVAVCTAGSCVFLLANLFFNGIVAATYKHNGEVATLYEGSCETVSWWSVTAHLIINILSSGLLSASNYTMQALSSPTRADVDAAHAAEDWVCIGVPSLRNIRGKVTWRRSIVWAILALTSLPIHFLYNSAIFKTVAANKISVAIATPNFILNSTMPSAGGPYAQFHYYAGFQSFPRYVGNSSLPNVVNLSTSACIDLYSNEFLYDTGSLLLVTSNTGLAANLSLIDGAVSNHFGSNDSPDSASDGYQGEYDYFRSPRYGWMCSWWKPHAENKRKPNELWEKCNADTLKRTAQTWTIDVSGMPLAIARKENLLSIDYCLSMKTPQRCELQLSFKILAAAMCCGTIKAAAMLWALLAMPEPPLTTIGDAISCFLQSPDQYTKHLAKGPTTDGKLRSEGHSKLSRLSARRTWFSAISKVEWTMILVPCFASLGVSAYLLQYSITKYGQYYSGDIIPSAFSRSFGAVDPATFVKFGGDQRSQTGAGGLLRMTLLVNTPQFICSILYFAYNSLATSMLLAAEWNQYGLQKRYLRVSDPRGKQRSTYFLSLPYRYSIPLLVGSMVLHWLISQSFFLARISTNDWRPDGTVVAESFEDTISQAAYSCAPMLAAILLSLVMLLTLIGFGC
ncbi:hypothetical protein HII31_03543, partial [Pseudocercospora fuligena]